MKLCSGCNTNKELTEFGKDKSNEDGLLYTCKNCRRNLRRKNIRKNPEHYKEEYKKQESWRNEYRKRPEVVSREFNKRLVYNFNITIEKYNEMFTNQNGLCLVCDKPETGKKNKNLCVDHCHKTGKIRGLLCNRCNRVLGLMEDNQEYFRNAIKYLKETK